MGYFCTYILLLLQLSAIRGEYGIAVYEDVDGSQVAISENVEHYAGIILTLICKSNIAIHSSSHYDDKLFWSKKHFKNIDLKSLTIDNAKELPLFPNINESNYAVKHFHPLHLADSGIYLCRSLKYPYFKQVKLHVVIDPQPYKLMNIRTRRSFSTYDYADSIFTCAAGNATIDIIYICDNVKDCSDGSDENATLCGSDPCLDKEHCSSGRCVSQSSCCDKSENCTVQHSCCLELLGNKTSNIPLSNRAIINSSQKSDKKELTTFQIMWIVVICAVFLVLITMFVVLIQSRSKGGNAVTSNAAHGNRKSRKDAYNTTSFSYNPSGSA